MQLNTDLWPPCKAARRPGCPPHCPPRLFLPPVGLESEKSMGKAQWRAWPRPAWSSAPPTAAPAPILGPHITSSSPMGHLVSVLPNAPREASTLSPVTVLPHKAVGCCWGKSFSPTGECQDESGSPASLFAHSPKSPSPAPASCSTMPTPF